MKIIFFQTFKKRKNYTKAIKNQLSLLFFSSIFLFIVTPTAKMMQIK